MTRERMDALLLRCNGIGVVATNPNGHEMCYFYEDFDGPASGIKRAMAQLYPLQDAGVIKKLCFIEQQKPQTKEAHQ